MINKSLHSQYLIEPVEGETYFIANFVVSKNLSRFRATTHDFKITLSQQTFMRREKIELPLRSFKFTPIPEVAKVKSPEELDHLFGIFSPDIVIMKKFLIFSYTRLINY